MFFCTVAWRKCEPLRSEPFSYLTKTMGDTAQPHANKSASCDRTHASMPLDVAVHMCGGEDCDLDKSFDSRFFCKL